MTTYGPGEQRLRRALRRHAEPQPSPPIAGPFELLKIVNAHFDAGELRTVCFYLDISYDAIRGDCKTDKIRELIQHYRDTDEMERLLKALRDTRPDLNL